MDDEILDLVNRNDEIIGEINRKDYARLLSEGLGYIRAVDMFILNDKGQIYVPTRTSDKTIAPNGLDYSVGGHVSSGEDYITTLIRETEEELNIKIQEKDVEFVAEMISDEIRYIRHIFLLRRNQTPDFNPNDFVSAEWLFPDEVQQKIEEGYPAKNNLAETIEVLKNYLS